MGKRQSSPRLRLERQIERMQRRLLDTKKHRELAEARVAGINELIAELSKSGLLNRTALLGSILLRRNYAPREGGKDSCEVLQAALLVPGGLGVLLWDNEEALELQIDPEALEAAAWLHHLPFEKCEPALQALLEPHIEELVGRLMRLVG
jgi:hypothetical protein